MATSSVTITTECSICYETLKAPITLPCGHNFCLCCLQRYIGDKTETFQNVNIPEAGGKIFTTNFVVESSPPTTHVTGTTSPTTQVTGTTSLTTQVTGTTSPTTPLTGKTSPTTQVTGTTSLTTQVTGTTSPTTQVTGTTSPTTKVTSTTSPSTKVTGTTSLTTQITGTTSHTTQVTGTTSPTTQVTGTTSNTTQVTGTPSPTTQVTGTTSPTTQVTGTTSPTTHLPDKTFSKVKYHCPCHRERPIDYYCLTCQCVLCYKCYVKKHKDHDYLDVKCETVKQKATKLVLTSGKCIQNKIKDLEETHAALVEERETLKRFTEDACSSITKQTDKIITDIKTSSERIMTDIKNKSEESESKLTEIGEILMERIEFFKVELEKNFTSLTEDSALQILVSLEKIQYLEGYSKVFQARTLSVVQYLDWIEKDFSLNIDMLGSMVLKQHHTTKLHKSMVLNSHQFIFKTSQIDYGGDTYYHKYKFRNNNLVWSCVIMRTLGILDIGFELKPFDNPKLNYCIIDGQISLLNINDDTKTITYTDSKKRLERGQCWWWWSYPVNIPELADINNGYVNPNRQFVIQFDITQIREIAWK